MAGYVEKIDGFRSRIESIANENAARKARMDLLKKQIAEKKAELAGLGIEDVEKCDEELVKLKVKAETIAKKIDEELRDAEEKLGIS